MTTNQSSKQTFWDGFAAKYAKVELANFQGGYSTFVLSNSQKPGARVCEVGCGSGTGSEIISSAVLSRQGSPVLVVSDFSGEMVRMTKQRFEDSDFALVPANKVVIDAETDYVNNGEKINLDQIVADQGEFRKMVFGCRASGTALPFPD